MTIRFFSNRFLPLVFLVLICSTITVTEADNADKAISSSASQASASDTISIDLNTDNDNELEDEVMHETIATGRGDRDEVGEREEWSSSDHLRESSRFDTRKGKPISSRIKRKLQYFRLECNGCDHGEAVAKINAFILDAKRQAEVQAQRQSLLAVVVQVVVGVALCVLGYFFYIDSSTNNKKGSSTYNTLGGGGSGSDDNKRRLQIEDQRQRAAARQEQQEKKAVSQRANAPTWVDIEMREDWTHKQEKQFTNAVRMYGGMAPKARYRLIADNVDDKTKQECLMHHKLQQLIAKEQ